MMRRADDVATVPQLAAGMRNNKEWTLGLPNPRANDVRRKGTTKHTKHTNNTDNNSIDKA